MQTNSHSNRGGLKLRHYSWKAIDPGVVYANRLVCEPGFVFGPRTIQDHQFIYVVKGKGTARIQDRAYRLSAGDLVYYGPDIVHEFQADLQEPFVVYGLHFALFRSDAPEASPFPVGIRSAAFDEQDTYRKQNALIIGNEPGSVFEIPEYGRPGEWVHHFFAMFVKLHHARDELSFIHIRAVFIELLVKLARWANRERHVRGEHAETVLRVRKLLEQHADQAYDRKWLYQWSSYHENHLARLFHQLAGMSPHDYHQKQKLELAQKWLRETSLPIGDIAARLHFSSIHYFSKWFRNAVGTAPTSYRRDHKLI